MPKSIQQHVLLVIKIIWENAATFLGIREETAVAFFAVLGSYQRNFYASLPSVSAILSPDFMKSVMLLCNYFKAVCLCVCVYICMGVCVITMFVPC